MQDATYNYNNDKAENNNVTVSMMFLDFIILWYYFFSPSMVLRPFASFIWVAIAICGLVVFNCRRIRSDRYFKLSMLAVGALFFSSLYSIDIGASMKYTLSIFLYMIVAYEVCSNHNNIIFFIKMAVPFIAVHAIATIVQIFNISLYRSIFLPLLPSEYHYRIIAFASRLAYTGFTNQTSTNADFLSLGVGVLTFFAIINPKGKKAVSIASILGVVILVAMTERRWPTIVVIVLLLIAILTQVKSRALKSIIIILIILLASAGVFNSLTAFQGIIGKMQFEISAGDVSNGRTTIWKNTWDQIMQRPFLGYGTDTFRLLIPTEANAHNSFLQTILEMGFIGAILFYAPFVFLLLKSIGFLRRERLFTMDNSKRAVVFFSLYWQAYCFLDSLFESYFSSELSIFMLFISQYMMLRTMESINTNGNE